MSDNDALRMLDENWRKAAANNRALARQPGAPYEDRHADWVREARLRGRAAGLERCASDLLQALGEVTR